MLRKGKKKSERDVVLVAVLKDPRDLRILRRKRWYRIPLAFLPKRKFHYLAFYQPAIFGKNGTRIAYYGRVARQRVAERVKLLPCEVSHPRAHHLYAQIFLKRIETLPRPIRNVAPRRVSFGFTTLAKLRTAKNLLALYGVPPTEDIMARALRRENLRALREFPVSLAGKRFRLDFAVLAGGRRIAIECDNEKAHANKIQRRRDRAKNIVLRRAGWRVIRLGEHDITEHLDVCMERIRINIEKI
ncbi:MAG: DUF559 domain-containing protein [Candidatus Brennerbacteria bacterium]|nr:DUF559 domain-containing protein [Candidatus Brennerbacteria bacterium]